MKKCPILRSRILNESQKKNTIVDKLNYLESQRINFPKELDQKFAIVKNIQVDYSNFINLSNLPKTKLKYKMYSKKRTEIKIKHHLTQTLPKDNNAATINILYHNKIKNFDKLIKSPKVNVKKVQFEDDIEVKDKEKTKLLGKDNKINYNSQMKYLLSPRKLRFKNILKTNKLDDIKLELSGCVRISKKISDKLLNFKLDNYSEDSKASSNKINEIYNDDSESEKSFCKNLSKRFFISEKKYDNKKDHLKFYNNFGLSKNTNFLTHTQTNSNAKKVNQEYDLNNDDQIEDEKFLNNIKSCSSLTEKKFLETQLNTSRSMNTIHSLPTQTFYKVCDNESLNTSRLTNFFTKKIENLSKRNTKEEIDFTKYYDNLGKVVYIYGNGHHGKSITNLKNGYFMNSEKNKKYELTNLMEQNEDVTYKYRDLVMEKYGLLLTNKGFNFEV